MLPASSRGWSSMLVLSFLRSGLAYLFWFRALEDVSASKAGIYPFFIPVLSVLIAHLILLEPLDSPFLIGALFVMLGTAVVHRS